jgi:aminoglycoside phosphotransferase (APT) family kinase protein
VTEPIGAESAALVEQRLRAFLAARRPNAQNIDVSGLHRSGNGSSRENWPFDVTYTWADSTTSQRLLLRRDPPSSVVDTGRATEFALLTALEPTPVPAPVVHWLDDTGDELLRPGMIVDRHAGTAHRGVLREKNPLGLSAQTRTALAERLCELLAQVHLVDVTATGLSEILPTPVPDPATAELDRWTHQLDQAELEPQPVLRWALRWLRDHRPPPPERLVLVHGDFRPANILVQDGTVAVLLDWELAHLGDPVDDLGWYCAPVYTREHFIPGRWEKSEFLDRYSRLTGIQVTSAALRFWELLSMFRLAVIALQGVRILCAGATDRPAAAPTALLRMVAETVAEHPTEA